MLIGILLDNVNFSSAAFSSTPPNRLTSSPAALFILMFPTAALVSRGGLEEAFVVVSALSVCVRV